jgi:hypothetical protein
MLYWLTNTGTSSAQLYWENNANNFNAVDGPMMFGHDIKGIQHESKPVRVHRYIHCRKRGCD